MYEVATQAGLALANLFAGLAGIQDSYWDVMFDQQASQFGSLNKIRFFILLLVVRFEREEGLDTIIQLDFVACVALILERIACGFFLNVLELLIGQDCAMHVKVDDMVVAFSVF